MTNNAGYRKTTGVVYNFKASTHD